MEFTVLAFSKKIVKENEVDSRKQSEYLIYYFLIALVQAGFIGCMALAIINEHIDYGLYVNPYYSLILVKFVSSCALHMMLYPFVGRSMALMKYVLNHNEHFTHPTLATLVPFIDLNLNIAAEFLNLFMLLYQHTVEHAIIHFVALEVIVEIPHKYMESLLDDQLKERVFHHGHAHLDVTNKGKDIPFIKRSGTNKLFRFLYRLYRALYVAVIFYFQPFLLMFCYKFFVHQGHFMAHH